MDPFERFPSFKPLFETNGTVPRYLSLLNAVREDAAFSIAEIRAARTRSGPSLDGELEGLLLYENWRPQIVGAVTLFLGATPTQIETLWHAIDKPSWISPQLAATAYHVDSNFRAEAQRRVEGRGRLLTDVAAKMTWLERHSALGPGSLDAHSAKLVAALVALLKLDGTDQPIWLEAPDISRMVGSDVDNGGDIAVGWLGDIRKMLEHPIAKNVKPN